MSIPFVLYHNYRSMGIRNYIKEHHKNGALYIKFVGPPGIKPEPHPPEGRILSLYYGPNNWHITLRLLI